jgi:nucleoside-diphosphate-sugar epimerase
MKILITGHKGFLGTHLARELREANHDVSGVDYAVIPSDDLRVAGVAGRVIAAAAPEVVVHLAAKVGRLFGEDNPEETIIDNAGMTALVAKAAADHAARFVYASTSEVYGDQGDRWCYEDGRLTLPHNIYGLSKRWGEEAAQLYAPNDLTVLRFSMPYGPGLPAGRGRAAIINMLWQALRHEPIIVHADAERSWCWVGDTVRAARLAIESGHGETFNIGRDDDTTSMLAVAEIACDLTGAPTSLIEIVDPPTRQTVVKRLSTEKIRAYGWKPEVRLREGMERTLEWVRRLDEDGMPTAEALELV